MKPINIFAAFLIIVFYQNILAQDPDPLSFFPHSVGNIWEYDTPNGIQRYEIIGDSIAPDKSIFIYFNRYPSYRIDTNYSVYSDPNGLNWLDYKLDAGSGDYWIYNQIDPAWWFAFVAQVDTAIVFGVERILKKIEYGFCRDTTYEPDYFFVIFYKILAEGIGLIYEWNEEPPQGPQKIIRGCVIDGDTFGVVTTVKEDIILSDEFSLFQNYPNPFNPETIIRFQIPEYSYVKLKVFNLLGEEIDVLVNEIKYPGSYEVKFDAKNLSSGVYIAVLQTTEAQLTKAMLLIK